MAIHKTMNYRRHQERVHQKRLKDISEYCGYPGIKNVGYDWHSGMDNFYYYKSVGRGKASRYLKNQSNRAVRRMKCGSGGQYKKCYDYWWKLT